MICHINSYKWSNGWLRATRVGPIIVYWGGYDTIHRVGVVYPSQPGSVRPTGDEVLISLDDFLEDPRQLAHGNVLTLGDHLEDGWSLIYEGKLVARGDWQ